MKKNYLLNKEKTMNEFKLYQRKGLSEMRPYVAGESMENISVADVDLAVGLDNDMGMVARNPLNNDDQWYVARKYFDENLEPAEMPAGKSLANSDVNGARKNVKDIVVFGNGDMFKLICKASSEKEGWMKSTKAMQCGMAGCLVQVTTQQRNPNGSYVVAEALSFVPGVRITNDQNSEGRKLVEMKH
jgi:hypothetical protein